MEVEVCNGAWEHGSILSIRVGGTRRQAPLQMNKRLAFAKALEETNHMQVDVFTRVVSSQIFIEPSQEVYQIATDKEGFSELTLRLSNSGTSQPSANAYPRKHDDNIISAGTGEDMSAEERLEQVRRNAEEYVEHFGLRQTLQDMFQNVIKDRPEDPFDVMQAFLGENAAKFFDQTYKTQSVELKVASNIEEAKRVDQLKRYEESIAEQREEILRLKRQRQDEKVAPNTEEEEKRAEQLKIYERTIAEQREEIKNLKKQKEEAKVLAEGGEFSKVDENSQRYEQCIAEKLGEIQNLKDTLESTVREASTLREKLSLSNTSDMGQDKFALIDEQAKTAKLQKQVLSLEEEILEGRLAADTQREEIKDLLKNIDSLQKQCDGRGASSPDKADILIESENFKKRLIEDYNKLNSKCDALQQENMELSRRLQASKTNAVPDVPRNGRSTPGDEAAGTGVDISVDKQASVEAVKMMAPSSTMTTATPLQSSNGFATQTSRSEGQSFGSTAMPPHWAQTTSSTISTIAGSEVNTHMLSQLLASSYAPPVPPGTYFERREDNEEDIQVLEGSLQSNPELVVDIVDCVDKTINGTYAWVGTCNHRPLYRLLGPEPRYLYYAEVDPAWAGWWVADKMGAEEYNEWFREPADAKLPVFCRKGELGSRVIKTELTREIAKKIIKVGNQAEKATIRSKLTEAFGATFTKLDGSQRGLMSKTSPVVGIAHALEAQQRAIQLLHSQLSTETQRREAAETHAQTMEEAFETLQLRIQAQLPGATPQVI